MAQISLKLHSYHQRDHMKWTTSDWWSWKWEIDSKNGYTKIAFIIENNSLTVYMMICITLLWSYEWEIWKCRWMRPSHEREVTIIPIILSKIIVCIYCGKVDISWITVICEHAHVQQNRFQQQQTQLGKWVVPCCQERCISVDCSNPGGERRFPHAISVSGQCVWVLKNMGGNI